MFKFQTETAVERLVLGRAALREFLPLVYPVAQRFNWIEDNTMPTCAVEYNGNFRYNKAFIESLRDVYEAVNVVAHEAMHIVQQHHYRTPIIPGIDQHTVNLIFNIAGDRVLSALLWNENDQVFARNRIITEIVNMNQAAVDEVTNKYKYTEALFAEMLKAYKKSCDRQSGGKENADTPGKGNSQGQGQGKGQTGNNPSQEHGDSSHDIIQKVKDGLDPGPIRDTLQPSGEKCQAHKHNGAAKDEDITKDEYDPWRMSVQMGQELQKSRGDQTSEGLREFIAKLFAPKISWKSVLMQYLDKVFGFHEYNFTKRARRSITDEIIFPGNDPPYGRVAVAIDMSGSMSVEERIAALSETYAICGSYVSGVTCIMHTSDVYFVGTIKNPEEVHNIPWSNGGTSHLEVFQVLENEHPKFQDDDNEHPIQLLVCFTDMETVFPDKAPKIPVIWVDTTSRCRDVPFGEIIAYKV